MRNGKYSRAEYALIDLEWFAQGILQQIHELEDRPPNKKTTARLIRKATKELRTLRQSYEPARPRIGFWWWA